ncbi:hypothetical protein JNJ66_01965 [Candidatus Saccharibacteria bacterium]|nr:hypothetical protein [Candidatus Saccharibacteria bacterium]
MRDIAASAQPTEDNFTPQQAQHNDDDERTGPPFDSPDKEADMPFEQHPLTDYSDTDETERYNTGIIGDTELDDPDDNAVIGYDPSKDKRVA